MKYTKEFNASTFHWWGGAVSVVNEVKDAGKLDELTQHIEDIFDGAMPSETDINDYVWFDYASVEEALGIGFENEEEDE